MSHASPTGSGGTDPLIELLGLGRTDLRVDGDVATTVLAQPKRMGLLAYLLLARPRGPQQRDALLPVFWPESSEGKARQSLNQALAFLRRALGRGAIVSHGRAAIEASTSRVHCDVLEFEAELEAGRLAAGLEAYRGELLPGLYVAGSRQFERWLDGERDRLRSRALDAVRDLVDRLALEARLDEATAWCRRALEIDPLEPRMMRMALDLHARAGDERGLEREFRGCTDRLRAALGIDPPQALQEAYRVARAQARRVAVARVEPDRRPPSAPEPEPAIVRVSTDRPPDPVPAGRGVFRGRGATWSRPWRTPAGRFGVGAVTGAAVLLAVYLLRADPEAAAVTLDARKVLVAPLVTTGGSMGRGGLQRLAVDWAARELARTGVVRVVAPGIAGLRRPSSDTAVSVPDPLELALQAGAGLVVSGSLREADGRGIIEAAVVETATGRIVSHFGPVELDPASPAAGLTAFTDRVASAVAVAADPTLGEWVATVSVPPDFQAYLLFSEGLDALAELRSVDAAERFLAAARRDATFVTAKIWAIRAYVDAHRHREADSIARSILDLRSSLIGWDQAMFDYYVAYLWGTWEEAYQATRRLVEIAPDPDWRHQLASTAHATGRIDEARAIVEDLQDDDRWIRDAPHRWRLHAFILHDLGDFEAELSLAAHWRERTPTASEMASIGALAGLGRVDELAIRIDRLMANTPDPLTRRRRLQLATYELRAHGQASSEMLERWLAEVGSADPREDSLSHTVDRAEALIAAGNYQEAYDLTSRLRADAAVEEPGSLVALQRGLAAAYLGKEDEARRIADRLSDDSPLGQGHWTALSARILAALGDTDEAAERLDTAFDQGFGRYPWLHTVPEFLSLGL